jgi:hypothetical protein
MTKLLTSEEKHYLRKVSNYLESLGMKYGDIEIEIDYELDSNYDDIDWRYVNEFSNNYGSEIPPGLIPILQKIIKYCGDEKLIQEIGDEINYQTINFSIDTKSKDISLVHSWFWYDRSDGTTFEYDDEDDIERFTQWIESYFSNIQVPNDGILTVAYNGSGDSGYLEGSFKEKRDVTVPQEIEDWCYRVLSSEFGNWGDNEGSDGEFIFDFNTKIVTLDHTDNIEASQTDTYFNEDFSK